MLPKLEAEWVEEISPLHQEFNLLPAIQETATLLGIEMALEALDKAQQSCSEVAGTHLAYLGPHSEASISECTAWVHLALAITLHFL